MSVILVKVDKTTDKLYDTVANSFVGIIRSSVNTSSKVRVFNVHGAHGGSPVAWFTTKDKAVAFVKRNFGSDLVEDFDNETNCNYDSPSDVNQLLRVIGG